MKHLPKVKGRYKTKPKAPQKKAVKGRAGSSGKKKRGKRK
jgi:hypothetical protein